MKIAIYAPAWPPGSAANGIVTYTSHLVPALRQLGHEVFVLSHWVNEVDPFTVDLKKFNSAPSLTTRAMFKVAPLTTQFNGMSSMIAKAVRELVVQHHLDVFEMEESFGWSLAVSRLNLAPVVVRLHGPWFLMGKFDNQYESDSKNRHRDRMEGRAIRDAHYITANCRDTLGAVERHYGASLNKSYVMPNPIDLVPEKEAWSVDSCDVYRLLFVGRFDKVKGGDLVLRAFGQLATAFPRLRLTFIGPDTGIEYKDGKKCNFDEFVRKNLPEVVRSRIDFRGKLDHAELMTYRNRHFITIIAAQYDTMGYMMLEAMSRGCPIVSTAVGGIPEYIRDGQNGLLVPSQDPNAMAGACRILLENKDLAAALGRQAWLECRDLYNPARIAKLTISAYRDAIDSAGLRH